MISDEAVEAAAKAIYRTSGRKRVMLYDEARNGCKADALEILEAAAPHMQAEAWQSGYLMSYYLDRGYDEQKAATYPVPEHLEEQLNQWNPYRSQA